MSKARWLVLSPHCDDAVLSLGASIAAHARAGGRVTIVTALAGDVHSADPSSAWDGRRRARARRWTRPARARRRRSGG
jgi:LmbE family N-acetylglucosaminyl deacetylase